MNNNSLVGKQAIIQVEIVEYLNLGNKQWFTVKLPNGQKTTINTDYCSIVLSENHANKKLS